MAPAKPAPQRKKKLPRPRKKRQNQQPQQLQQKQRQQRKLRKENAKRNTKKRKASMQCTRLKATKFPGHVQPASGVDQDTSWQITMTGTLAVTVALHATNRNKQF